MLKYYFLKSTSTLSKNITIFPHHNAEIKHLLHRINLSDLWRLEYYQPRVNKRCWQQYWCIRSISLWNNPSVHHIARRLKQMMWQYEYYHRTQTNGAKQLALPLMQHMNFVQLQMFCDQVDSLSGDVKRTGNLLQTIVVCSRLTTTTLIVTNFIKQ